MFVVGRTHGVLVAVLALALDAGLGGIGYAGLMAAGRKVDAERLLLVSLVGFGLIAVALISAMLFSRRRLSSLDRVADMARFGGNVPEERLLSFGSLGLKLRSLYRELAELNERKSRRIRHLNAMLNVTLDLVDEPVLLLQPSGEVARAGRGFLERHKVSRDAVVGKGIADVLRDVDFRQILQEATRTRRPVEMGPERERVRFAPVFLEQGEIGFLLVTVEGRSLVKLPEQKERGEADGSKRAERARRFSLREWLRRR